LAIKKKLSLSLPLSLSPSLSLSLSLDLSIDLSIDLSSCFSISFSTLIYSARIPEFSNSIEFPPRFLFLRRNGEEERIGREEERESNDFTDVIDG
jgi:hypothetical protein